MESQGKKVKGVAGVPAPDIRVRDGAMTDLAAGFVSQKGVTAKLKKLLRDGAERTVDKLWELCGRILDEFTPTECQNYFKHCGYRYV